MIFNKVAVSLSCFLHEEIRSSFYCSFVFLVVSLGCFSLIFFSLVCHVLIVLALYTYVKLMMLTIVSGSAI